MTAKPAKASKPRIKRSKMSETTNVRRKSLMISEEAHAHLMRLAGKFEVSQPELVEAMISITDTHRLTAKLAETAAARQQAREEAEARKSMIDRALREMSTDQLADLLKQAGVKTS